MAPRRDDRPGIAAIFADIASSCRRLGSPTYADWAECVVAWREDEPLRTLLAPYAEARVGDMVPLRLFAAIHRLVLERQARIGGMIAHACFCDVEQRGALYGDCHEASRTLLLKLRI